jgi:hypothetical protein
VIGTTGEGYHEATCHQMATGNREVPGHLREANLIAARMRAYVPQRQMFPAIAASISESSGAGLRSMRAAALMI